MILNHMNHDVNGRQDNKKHQSTKLHGTFCCQQLHFTGQHGIPTAWHEWITASSSDPTMDLFLKTAAHQFRGWYDDDEDRWMLMDEWCFHWFISLPSHPTWQRDTSRFSRRRWWADHTIWPTVVPNLLVDAPPRKNRDGVRTHAW